MTKWYLLYGGSSPDGRGQGEYKGRTTNRDKALAHFLKVASNPYSTGGVTVVTDKEMTRACCADDL